MKTRERIRAETEALFDLQGNPVTLRGTEPKWRPEPGHEELFSPIRERIVDTSDGFVIEKTQNVDGILDAIHDAGALLPKKTKADGARYIGSIPLLVAKKWSKDCGAPIGSREFLDYAYKKLLDGEFAKLRIDYR